MKRLSLRPTLQAICLCCLGLMPLAARAEPGVVTEDQLLAVPPLGWLASRFEMPQPNPALPLVSVTDASPEAAILRQLQAAGRAAGYQGVIYDNRDRGHSLPDPEWMPALPLLTYGTTLIKKGADYGLGGEIILPGIVLGNSSTAITKGDARSQPRLAMTTPGWAQ
ncbi:hypothetical protein HA397_30260, partial [Escherichia coli]|nr:hypothetical protein [Escherichia coli]